MLRVFKILLVIKEVCIWKVFAPCYDGMTIELVRTHLDDVTMLVVFLEIGVHASHTHEVGKILSLCFSYSILKVF